MHRGVYAVGHRVLSPDGYRMAAVLASGPNAVLSHRSAAAAWGVRPTARSRVEVTTPARSGRRGPPRVEIHRVTALAVDDVTCLRNLPITTIARTLLDLATVLSPHALERAVNQAEVLQVLDVTAVRAAIDRTPNRKGTKHLRAILSVPSPGPTRSKLEYRFLALCRRGDVQIPRLNTHVDTGGRLVEVDALWPQERLVAELDGGAVHHTPKAFEDDRAKDAALAARGYLVVRFTWHRITHEPRAVQAELRRILALRARDCAA